MKKLQKKCLKIMNGDINSEKNIYCVHDGSLPDGFELPTMPGTLAYHKTLPYKKLFEYLDSKGYKSHDTTTCGLHIHINRSYFEGQDESEYAGKLIYITEKFNDEFSILARRNCKYARFVGYSNEKCKEIYNKSQNNDLLYIQSKKYKAVNLQHKDTIELRSFKGTLKYTTFINTLEFVSCLAAFVKNHSEEEVENMEWSDLYNTFSDELKEYYDERKKYELEKVKKNKCENTQISYVVNNMVSASNTTQDYFQDLITSAQDFLNHQNELAAQNNPETCTDIKAAKKARNKVKKELRFERNYIQRQLLQQKILNWNKCIKKLKREEREELNNV